MFRVLFAVFLLAASVVSAGVIPLTGTRTTEGGGLVGTGGYADFKIAWTIEQLENGSWQYSYVFTKEDGSALKQNVSHVLLEVSPVITSVNLSQKIFNSNQDSGLFKVGTFTSDGNGESNPYLPGSIYALSTGAFSGSSLTFTSTQAPIWGDIYLKDGKDPESRDFNTISNSSFGSDPSAQTSDFSGWLPTPDTVSGVPEPASVVLLGTALLGCMSVVRRRMRAR